MLLRNQETQAAVLRKDKNLKLRMVNRMARREKRVLILKMQWWVFVH
jgi:hypothetical protein